MLLSIIIPVFKAKDTIHELLERCNAAVQFAGEDYELLLVEDGSGDDTWAVIEQKCKTEKNIKAIKLSRNFGQHHAITAGLDYCKGDWVVVMDCDLQDRPEEIEKLYAKAREGFDIVYARRADRKDPFLKKLQAGFFYAIFSFLTGVKYDGTIGNFGIYNRKVIEALKKIKEPMRAFSPMVRWVGFTHTSVNVVHGVRFSGKSTYTFIKTLSLAFGIILSYSDKPLKLIVRLGFLISLIAAVTGIVYFVKYMNGQILVSGYTSIILSIWFLGGLTIFTLGIIGLYISQIFTGIKNRPFYIVDKVIETAGQFSTNK